ncbi:hypothetical protein [Salininema proteolyticum]|uniref:Uncharacterized protein n=1 Tax=Salininema proteolyticum TaxID=1607685 RepID=A0ABV8TZI5_9ACTN
MADTGSRRTQADRGARLILWGWILTAVGVVMLMVGVGGGNAVNSAADGDYSRPGPWIAFAVLLAVALPGIPLLVRGRTMRAQGRQLKATTLESFDSVLNGRYVLYLRPFDFDEAMRELPTEPPSRLWSSEFNLSSRTHEESLLRWFRKTGRSVAVGRPDETHPMPGADRGYLRHDDWKEVVGRLIARAHSVLISIGPRPGTVWEFTEALRACPPERVILPVYRRPEAYARFVHMVREEYHRRKRTEAGPWPEPPTFPAYPLKRHPNRRDWDFALKGVITFDSQWRGEFTYFDPTLPLIPVMLAFDRIQRQGMRPLAERLASLPDRDIRPPESL